MKQFRFLVGFIMAVAACGGGRGDDAVAPDAAEHHYMPGGVTTLAMGEHGPNGIVADETAVWFIAAGDAKHSIRKVDLQTSEVTTLVADVGGTVRMIGDAEALYYGDGTPGGKLSAASKRDGTTRVVLDNPGETMSNLGSDDSSLYWIAWDPTRMKSVVHAIGKDGTGHHEIAVMTGSFNELLVDNTFVYSLAPGALVAFDKATGTVKQLASVPGSGNANLAQDGGHIYIASRADNTITMVAKTGGTPTVVASNLPVPGRMAVTDDGTVYVANRGSMDNASTTAGSVIKIAAGAATPTTIAMGLDHAIEPALLDQAVVWTVFGPIQTGTMSGAVMAAPR